MALRFSAYVRCPATWIARAQRFYVCNGDVYSRPNTHSSRHGGDATSKTGLTDFFRSPQRGRRSTTHCTSLVNVQVTCAARRHSKRASAAAHARKPQKRKLARRAWLCAEFWRGCRGQSCQRRRQTMSASHSMSSHSVEVQGSQRLQPVDGRRYAPCMHCQRVLRRRFLTSACGRWSRRSQIQT